MKLKPDEISVALGALAALLDHKGEVLVNTTTEERDGKVRDVALHLDATDRLHYARISVDPVHRGPADPPLAPEVYPLAPLAAFLAKGKRKGALVRLTGTDGHLTARDMEGHTKTWDAVTTRWPKGIVLPVGGPTESRRMELPEFMEAPPPTVLDAARVITAVGTIIRPPSVTVQRYPGIALVYEGRWFGVRFRIVLRAPRSK